MNEPKRHHVMPESYLKRFCRDGVLWVFSREHGTCLPQTPTNTAVRKHFYSFVDGAGARRTDVEKKLAQFEGLAAPAFDRLVAGDYISAEQRGAISAFVAFAMNRTVGFKEDYDAVRTGMVKFIGDIAFASVEATKATLSRHERDTGEKIEQCAEEIYAAHWSGKFEFDVARNESLRAMLSTAEALASAFGGMRWTVFHAAEGKSFITSDNPLFLVPTRPVNPRMPGVGILTPGVINVFPISQDACLFMEAAEGADEVRHIRMPGADVRRVNLRTALHCDHYIFARDEALARSIASHTRIEQRQRLPRFSIR